ncbi:MAG: gluconate 2-dehydrogenase subunit 3 family protein [Deltaproteobacteria bacterium]|nr:gluconate 2-dehydrogenase subunit 3 family protein [Deltaproteobacteria bacterium]
MTDPRLSRRQLLKDGSLLGGGLWLGSQIPYPLASRAAAASDQPEVLNTTEWKTLEAITARILPTDHQPGAKEAGCTNFIDKALLHEEEEALPQYQKGLAELEAAAMASHSQAFAALTAAEQDRLLVAIEESEFFETVRVHTLIGFLADPKYGGNRDFAGWRVAGYPGPRHRRGGYTPEQVTGEAPVRTVWDD